ncbi:hypothetical protein Taro_032987 [Colocasia esculenta]|uniref:Nuclease HARBI1 n=1 Tax=Colocasia esculenta TaxID=4460 RepID=A0A843VYU6_COLES|nr:hypothetical protein [Colocasia esculenta]
MMNTSQHTGEVWVNSILTGHEKRCYNVFRVHPEVFTHLRDLLVSKSLIGDSRQVSANEQLAMFLYVVGHGVSTGVLMEHFQHSSQTISHYVNKLAFSLASLAEEYILQPNVTNDCHPYIASNERFYPYFKDALGAIDGTHVPANVPIEDHPQFHNRKQQITQNVMEVVSFDGLFTYSCVGWEGNMWSDQMDITLLEMLDDELKLGGGAYLQFSEQTWEFIARGLNAITGVNYPVSTIKARITFYKIVYYTVEDMVGAAGFAWDSNPPADSIRGKKFPWY